MAHFDAAVVRVVLDELFLLVDELEEPAHVVRVLGEAERLEHACRLVRVRLLD